MAISLGILTQHFQTNPYPIIISWKHLQKDQNFHHIQLAWKMHESSIVFHHFLIITLWWTNILPWKITIFNGKNHYFYGHFPLQTVSSPGRVFCVVRIAQAVSPRLFGEFPGKTFPSFFSHDWPLYPTMRALLDHIYETIFDHQCSNRANSGLLHSKTI